jgi:hypothetical protein
MEIKMNKHTLLFLLVVIFALTMMVSCEPDLTLPSNTIVVTKIADSGPGTLRQALLDAISGDVITFDPYPSGFPPNAPATITLLSALPELSRGNLTIDASDAGVILNGKDITSPDLQYGLSISSNRNIIRGLQIIGFSGAGIRLYGGARYNMIGGDRTVGNGPLGQGNLISGNGDFGIGLWDAGTSGNAIQGNYIGINIDGTATWGHARDGIHSNGAVYNRIIGNVIGGNESSGVYLCCAADGLNTIQNNLIGVGPNGNDFGNGSGVLIDRTSHNVVGPGNTIAYNHRNGLSFQEGTPNNSVTHNSIRDNGGRGIGISDDSQNTLQPPQIIVWDLQAGTLAGVACANCKVEIFSDQGGQGAVYEGQSIADSTGYFYLNNGAFSGPRLTSTATDSAGTSSSFSIPTSSPSGERLLQIGNHQPFSYINTLCSTELANNYIGTFWGYMENIAGWGTGCVLQGTKGFKMVRLSFNEVEVWPPNEPDIDWGKSEFNIQTEQDDFVDDLVASGITVTYILSFWDKSNHPNGWTPTPPYYSRFTTDIEIQRYLDYVQYTVHHFKDHGVHYYELWNEPNSQSSAIQYITPEDYVELVRRVVPVIRGEDLDAKIVVGSVTYLLGADAHNYLYQIIESDIMPLVDVVAWHPMYGTSPDHPVIDRAEWDYYYAYPGILQEIKNIAISHGFSGEFRGDEVGWCSPEMGDCGAALYSHTSITAAKYTLRGIVIHLGLGAAVHLGGMSDRRLETNLAVSNLATILAGARAESLPVGVETISPNVMGYTFTLPNGELEMQTTGTNVVGYAFTFSNGETLVALWNDGVAVEEDPGISAVLKFSPDSYVQRVIGVDVLHGFEQPLITETENGGLIVRDFLVKDYPIILRLFH